MLRGDVTVLAKLLGVTRRTIYYRAKKIGFNLKRTGNRDPNTVDMFSGQTLGSEHEVFMATAFIALSKGAI